MSFLSPEENGTEADGVNGRSGSLIPSLSVCLERLRILPQHHHSPPPTRDLFYLHWELPAPPAEDWQLVLRHFHPHIHHKSKERETQGQEGGAMTFGDLERRAAWEERKQNNTLATSCFNLSLFFASRFI